MADSSAPIVIVYDSDVTYNQATTQMADSGVYDKLTFELLMDETKQNKLKVQSNKPNGPIDRLLSDVLGLVVLYATTFLFCDLYRTWKTGRWTRLMWMFLIWFAWERDYSKLWKILFVRIKKNAMLIFWTDKVLANAEPMHKETTRIVTWPRTNFKSVKKLHLRHARILVITTLLLNAMTRLVAILHWM